MVIKVFCFLKACWVICQCGSAYSRYTEMIVVGILVLDVLVVSSVVRSLIFPSNNIVHNIILLGNIHRWLHHEGFSSSIFIAISVFTYSYELLHSIIQHITVHNTTFELWSSVFYMNTFWNNYNIIIS